MNSCTQYPDIAAMSSAIAEIADKLERAQV
jgi:hypothetical protein